MATAHEDATNLTRDLAQLTCSSQAVTSPSCPALVELETSLTPTQRAIRSLLEVPLPLDQALVSALLTLKAMAKEQPIRQSRLVCCFDVDGMLDSSPAWCAQKVCQRCTAVSWVLQAWRDEVPNALTNRILQAYLSTTGCISSNAEPSENLCHLPNELMELIVDYAVDDMSETKDGRTVAALMHVSSWVRYLVVKGHQFELLEQHNLETANNSPWTQEEWESCHAQCGPALLLHFADFSVQKYRTAADHAPIDGVFWNSAPDARHMLVRVQVCVEDDVPFRQDSMRSYSSAADIPHVFNSTLCEVLNELTRESFGYTFPGPSMFPTRPVNLHQRALRNGSFSGARHEPGTSIHIHVMCFALAEGQATTGLPQGTGHCKYEFW